MKLPLALLHACLLLTTPILAQQRTRVTLHGATVFLNGAELYNTARIALPQGESEVLLTNIAGNINQQSLNIGAAGGVVIQSAVFQNNYLADSGLSPRARILRDSIQTLKHGQELNAEQRTIVQEQLQVLRENRKVAGDNAVLSVATLQQLLEITQTQLTTLLARQRALNEQQQKLNDHISLLSLQLNEEQQKNIQPGGQLLVRFYAPKAVTSDVSITYVTPNAAWRPAYDLRVDRVNDPVKLLYKANVFQNSGIVWKDIRLSLSTANPSEGAEAPGLQPWSLSFNQPVMAAAYNRTNRIQSNGYQGQEDYRAFRGNVYETYRRIAEDNSLEDRDSLGRYPEKTALNNFTQIDNSGINTSFDIELRYTIPSDGQQHHVAIKTYELPATYRYFAVPKIDPDAFLQAQITSWEDLNLLPAPTNIFFEGSYVGQGLIDMRNVRDTMNLSLGRDKKIIIRRERDKNYHSVKTIGSNERQTMGYTISVRNTRKEPVRLIVLDQLPLSTDKDIVIEDRETRDASYDEATGTARWSLDLKPAELRQLQLGYTVKYPKGKLIANLN